MSNSKRLNGAVIDYPRNTEGEEVAARALAGGAIFIFLLKRLNISKTVNVRTLIICARIVCYLLNVLCKFRGNW
ncbi:hypothetical protein C0J52_05397 [Blattella germanica]|nr:hypothetical protein C0J52_05397 [Blattella germanica]